MIRAALDFEISYGREAHPKTQESAKEITTLNRPAGTLVHNQFQFLKAKRREHVSSRQRATVQRSRVTT
jgi:hypothetical protein